jgi:small acid-soluble spore protein K (minor)
MRNKARNFPHRIKPDGEPRAKAEYASTRADGTINIHPQERMHASSQRNKDASELF